MAQIRGEFFQMHQDSQDYGSDDQHMVSRVFFTMAVDGQPVLDTDSGPKKLYVDVTLSVGGDYLKDELEITRPVGYAGEFNYAAFREEAVRFVRMCVGPGARGICIEGPCTVRMRNGHFDMRMPFQFQTSSYKTGTW